MATFDYYGYNVIAKTGAYVGTVFVYVCAEEFKARSNDEVLV